MSGRSCVASARYCGSATHSSAYVSGTRPALMLDASYTREICSQMLCTRDTADDDAGVTPTKRHTMTACFSGISSLHRCTDRAISAVLPAPDSPTTTTGTLGGGAAAAAGVDAPPAPAAAATAPPPPPPLGGAGGDAATADGAAASAAGPHRGSHARAMLASSGSRPTNVSQRDLAKARCRTVSRTTSSLTPSLARSSSASVMDASSATCRSAQSMSTWSPCEAMDKPSGRHATSYSYMFLAGNTEDSVSVRRTPRSRCNAHDIGSARQLTLRRDATRSLRHAACTDVHTPGHPRR
jgi:hypothetical protein